MKLEIVPVLLGGLHKLCNNTAPIFIKNKDVWINKERDRWASHFAIPVRPTAPRTFPVSTVNAMRSLIALQMELGEDGNEQVAQVLDAFWAMVWNPDAVKNQDLRDEGGKGEFDIKNVDTLKAVMGGIVDKDVAERVVKKIGEAKVKDQLGANTQRAFEAGAFGLPWFECVNEKGEKDGFWGLDHLGMVCRFLGIDVGKLEGGGKGTKVRALL